jgi:hypothetical protein
VKIPAKSDGYRILPAGTSHVVSRPACVKAAGLVAIAKVLEAARRPPEPRDALPIREAVVAPVHDGGRAANTRLEQHPPKVPNGIIFGKAIGR